MIGCEQRQFDSIDPIFEPYVNSFKVDHKDFKGKEISFDVAINFSNNIGEANAHCYIYANDKNEILVNPTWFNRISEGSKKALIYHELGHCALKQKHRDERIKTKISSSMKASIMNSNAFGTLTENDENETNEFYLYELFHKDQSIWEQFQ